MRNFDFLLEGVGLAFPLHFVYYFQRKNILILCSINWFNFIVWFPLLLEILDNICNVIICCPVCDDINFEINLNFHFKPFFYITKKSGQKCKHLKSEKEILT